MFVSVVGWLEESVDGGLEESVDGGLEESVEKHLFKSESWYSRVNVDIEKSHFLWVVIARFLGGGLWSIPET